MLKLATVLDNPGEPQPETRFRDPAHLRDLGYNGLVLYETTGLSGVEGPEAVGTGEMRRWVQSKFEQVAQTIAAAKKAGLEPYICYDALSLSRGVVERSVIDLVCRNRPTTLCPASEKALELSIHALDALLNRWPEVAGVVLRFGDSDAARLPYLVGNEIYSPHCARCSQLGRADRISLVLDHFHRLVVQQKNKRLIARAWNVRPNGMHDSAELCTRLRDRLPGQEQDDRFILSFKFTETDFWRWQKWNPSSLVFGQRPIIYELQCQREFEGKGGLANWQAPLWRDGYPETADKTSPAGLAQVADKVNLAGLWAWVRGGGWGGPFTKNETWIDANVVAVPQLADNPSIKSSELADGWIRDRLRITDPTTSGVIKKTLEHSPQEILHAFYIGPFSRSRGNPWHPNGDWIQDDLIDAQAAWRMVQRIAESELDEVVREKQDAVAQVAADRTALQQIVLAPSSGQGAGASSAAAGLRTTLEPLINTLIYSESLFSALRDLLAGFVAYRRFLKGRAPAQAALCKQKMLDAQTHWQQHVQRHATLPGVATPFREVNFWETTQRILGEVGT